MTENKTHNEIVKQLFALRGAKTAPPPTDQVTDLLKQFQVRT